ncbi:alpha-L-arabinofuranosidase [Opitutaceae bacterium TAV1]|nr:alpha-L-arabinofuranosidase [Opitutaceae bacterium TAV1]
MTPRPNNRHLVHRPLARLALSAALAAAPVYAAPDARITIDAARERGPVNPLVFGQNIEAGDAFGIFVDHHTRSDNAQGLWNPDTRDFQPGMIALADALRMGTVRYPGGCLVHNFNWKGTIGPLEERPGFQFGIDEWIKLCRRLGAEPVYTVADYYGTAEEAAELVEYLNAPATPDHPWAMKRAANGHPEPWNVRYFELGNESDHGNHQVKPGRTFSADEYASWARNYAKKMKAVDPSIKVGIVTPPSDGRNAESAWNTTVFREAGDFADFVVVHFYAPVAWKSMTSADLPVVNQACMAQTDQLGIRMDQYRAAIKAACGRDLPLAITEYNTWAADVENPVPYRFSFAPALQNADFVRLCLEPAQNDGVLMAQYWQMFNGWWGAVRKNGEIQHPAYALYRLWGKNRGATLLASAVDAPRQAFAGSRGISAAGGDRYIPRPPPEKMPQPASYPPGRINLDGATVRPTGDGLEVTFSNFRGEAYPQLFRFDNPDDGKGRRYDIAFEACLDLKDRPGAGDTGGNTTLKPPGEFGIGIEDTRGWEKTRSAASVSGIRNSGTWQEFRGSYTPPADGKAVRVLARLIARKPVTGTLRIRNLAVTRPLPDTMPAYPLLTATAMKSDDGRRVHVVVFNKSLDRSLTTGIVVNGFAATSGHFEQITAAGGDPSSTASPREETGDLRLATDGAPLLHTFPPCSMTAITLSR